MALTRYGAGDADPGQPPLPFARAVAAGGWLHVSGQVPIRNGEFVTGGIEAETRATMDNLVDVLAEAGFSLADVVRCGVWLDDAADFGVFNKVYIEYFGTTLPARACVQSRLMVDCKVEVDCVAYKGS